MGMYRQLRRLLAEESGSFAVAFGILIVPVIAMMGAAIDYNRAVAARAKLGSALDAAALALARRPLEGDASARQFLQDYIQATLEATGFPAAQWSISRFAQTTKSVQVELSGTVDTAIMALLSVDQISFSAATEVLRDQTKVEIALVLDNTGSMKGTRMANLKSAATDLVDTLAAAAARSGEPDAVRLALVPYTMTVNVGPHYANAAWIDSQGKSPINDQIFDGATQVKRLDLFQSMKTPWAGCVETRPAPYDVTETAPDPQVPATLYVPYFAPDEPDLTSGQYCNGSGYCNNYIADGTNSSDWKKRQGNVAKYTNAKPRTGTNPIGYQFGPNAGCEIQPLTRLTSNFTSFKTAIDAMTAGGDTNISAGLMWGWHTLSPHGPFGDGVPYGTEGYTKAIVLMTDGQNHNVVVSNNNQSVYSGIGYIWQNRLGISSGSLSQRIAKLDQKLATLCANVKAAGIVIYTIRLEHPDVDDSTIRNCASSPDKFFDVTDSAKLAAVFQRIAGDIQKLRVAR
jgi:Flp pilus assembly protein TadG